MKAKRVSAFRASTPSALVLTLLTSAPAALAAPAWYGANGGFVANGPKDANGNPTLSVPDFFQHQYWNPVGNQTIGYTSSNGWETPNVKAGSPGMGWCAFTSYDDLFYDLATQGYSFSGLTDPTPANAWYAATYGPAPTAQAPVTATSSNISAVAAFFQNNVKKGNSTPMQAFLDANVNNNPNNNKMPKLLSNVDSVNANGNMQYFNYATDQPATTSGSIFDFTNMSLKAGWDLSYELLDAPPVRQANKLWWLNHFVAVAGISTQKGNNTVFIADPDSNPNPNPPPPVLSAPSNFPSPGTIPAGLPTAPTDPLPVPTNPDPTKPATYNANYDDFQFTKSAVTSTQAPQFNNTTVAGVFNIFPSAVKTIKVAVKAKPTSVSSTSAQFTSADAGDEDETDITLQIPSAYNPVDGILIEPSTLAVNPASDPGSASLIDDSDTASVWSNQEDAQDPFGNSDAAQDVGIEYDLSSGNPLEPGETADIDLETDGDFSSLGYDILFHFQGDPSDAWLPEMMGGSEYDPSDYPSDDLVPEPVAIAPLAFVALTVSLGRRWRRTSPGFGAGAVSTRKPTGSYRWGLSQVKYFKLHHY